MSILLELFKQTVPWEIHNESAFSAEAEFTIDGLKYEVLLDGGSHNLVQLENPYEELDVWEISFVVSGTIARNNGADDERFTGTSDITGTGNALLVFSTVIEIINHFISTRNGLDSISFSAHQNEPTRIKLYNRMAQYYAKKGWRYISNEEIEARNETPYKPGGKNTNYYILTKQPKPAMQA
jgi:hypothetical protein